MLFRNIPVGRDSVQPVNVREIHSIDIGEARHLETSWHEPSGLDIRDPSSGQCEKRVVTFLGEFVADSLHIAHTETQTLAYPAQLRARSHVPFWSGHSTRIVLPLPAIVYTANRKYTIYFAY
jgi:hypothetical protein